jgi:hypothetical protein
MAGEMNLSAMMTLDITQVLSALQSTQEKIDNVKQQLKTSDDTKFADSINKSQNSFSSLKGVAAGGFGAVTTGALASEAGMLKLDTVIRGVMQTMNGLKSAANGSIGGLVSGLSGVTRLLGPVGVGLGAFSIAAYGAWKLGGVIGNTLGNSLVPLDTKIADVTKRFREMRLAMMDLDKVKMEQMGKELQKLSTIMSPFIQMYERSSRRSSRVSDAESNLNIAKINATEPEGLEKDKMLADAKYQATLQTIKSEEDLATDRITAAQSQKKAANDKLSKLQDDIANAESNWEKMSATERLSKARPEIDAVIDDANQEIADNMASITALFAEKQIAEYDLYGAHSKAVEKNQIAKASDKLDKSSDLPPSTKMDIASDRLSKIGGYVGGGVQNLAQKTAAATERTAKATEKMLQKLSLSQRYETAWGA